ncbi:J domain-containing protein [Chitinimonas sp. PSY-7]|uniref:J domain-containing protein n=1 Tax=Chitinimonas sp. PSY-7 TaxID=3459088 RepID=UPI00403FDA8F
MAVNDMTTDKDCWQVLGIAPTSDEREVKRTYAKLLKANRPEDDAEAFQALRTAFEAAMWAADELSQQPAPTVETSGPPVAEHSDSVLEAKLRPYIETLARLNEHGTCEETMQALAATLKELDLPNARQHDPQLWRMFENGMLWVCCDIAANHDEFLRAAIHLFGWIEPGNWLGEADPRTVEWLRLRLREAEALAVVDQLLDQLESGSEATATAKLAEMIDDDMLVNVDVRHLFEAELMVGLSDIEPLPVVFSRQAAALFGWHRDHRHLEEYHPEAWTLFQRKLLAV